MKIIKFILKNAFSGNYVSPSIAERVSCHAEGDCCDMEGVGTVAEGDCYSMEGVSSATEGDCCAGEGVSSLMEEDCCAEKLVSSGAEQVRGLLGGGSSPVLLVLLYF